MSDYIEKKQTKNVWNTPPGARQINTAHNVSPNISSSDCLSGHNGSQVDVCCCLDVAQHERRSLKFPGFDNEEN